jgi:hypothetical protein
VGHWRWRMLLAVTAVAVGVAFAVSGCSSPQKLTAYQQLKAQYFTAVSDIEPFWCSKAFNDTPIEATLKDEISALAADLRDEGASSKRVVLLLSYLLKVLPEVVLHSGSVGALDEARDHGLLDARYRPTVSATKANKMAASTHALYQGMGDELDGYGVTYAEQRQLCSPISNGRVIGNGTPRP